MRAEGGELLHGLVFVNGVGVRFLEMYYGETNLGVTGAAMVVADHAGISPVDLPHQIAGELARGMDDGLLAHADHGLHDPGDEAQIVAHHDDGHVLVEPPE